MSFTSLAGIIQSQPLPVYAESISDQPLLNVSNMKITNGNGGQDISSYLDTLKPLEEGSVTVRYRSSASQGLSAMLSMSSTDSSQQNTYAVCYVNPSSNTVGVEVRDQTGGNYNQVSVTNAGIKDGQWHTLTYCFGKSTFSIWIDGEKKAEEAKSGFYSRLTSPDTLLIGYQKRSNSSGQWQFTGDIDLVQVHDHVLGTGDISSLHASTALPETIPDDPEDTIFSTQRLFYNNYENSRAYRIPSLLTTKEGTIIAAIDKRNSGSADQGNIDTVIRRSFDGGKTWQNFQTIVDMPSGSGLHALSIDPSMIQDRETGRIFLVVDMFPESNAMMGTPMLAAHSGYKNVDGKYCLVLRDYENSNATEASIQWSTEYTVREDGVVFNETTGEATEYVLPDVAEGTLYKTVDGQQTEAGNIYLYTSDQAGELKAIRTSHYLMCYSDDDGATWSKPRDLNPGNKEDWMMFMGTGPGVGYQMETGRLVFPYYCANANFGASQSAGLMYSDDHGETWHRGATVSDALYTGGAENMSSGAMMTETQVVGVKNAEGEEILKLFCRNTGNNNVRIFTSHDGGETWDADYQVDSALKEPYCQLTVIPWHQEVEGYEGKQMFLFANPDSSSRSAGALQMGYYEPSTDSFVWIKKRSITGGAYAYSCLSEVGEDRIGLLWEGDNLDINFSTINTSWLFADKNPILRNAPKALRATAVSENQIVVSLDGPVMVMGSPKLKVTDAEGEKLLPYTQGSGTSELVFDASALGENPSIVSLELADSDSITNNENTALDASSLAGMKITVKGQETITGLQVSSGYATSTITFDAKAGSTYQIQRSANELIGYTTIGEVTAESDKATFQDPVGPGKQYFYRVLSNNQADTSASLQASMPTGEKALQSSAELYKNLIRTEFDGNTVVDLSEYAEILHTLDEGCLIVQFKSTEAKQGVLFNAAGSNPSGSVHNNSNMCTVLDTGDGRVRADLSATRANTNNNVAPAGEWHTFMVSNANSGKTLRFFIDGIEEHSWTASNLCGFLAHLPELTKVTVGGWQAGGSDAVVDGFKGQISYIAVTSEVIDDSSAKVLTGKDPVLCDKSALEEAVNYASSITEKPGYLDEAIWTQFTQALETAQNVLADDTADQAAVDEAETALVQAIHMLDFAADKADLVTLVAKALAIDPADYENDEAMSAFKSALADAEALLEDETATEAQIEEAAAALRLAMNGLNPVSEHVDTILLDWIIETVEQTDLGLYANPEEDLQAFRDALADAKAVSTNPASQDQVNAALRTLNGAWMNLRLKPSEELLNELKEAVAAVSLLNLEDTESPAVMKVTAWKSRAMTLMADPHLDAGQAQALLDDFNEIKPLVDSLSDPEPVKKPEETKPAENKPADNKPEKADPAETKPAAEKPAGTASTAKNEEKSVKPAETGKASSVKTGLFTGGWGLMAALSGLVLAGTKHRRK